VDHALGYVQASFGSSPVDAHARAEEQEDVVVVISRRGAPMWRVVREIESALSRE
jgi:hypothetical protein